MNSLKTIAVCAGIFMAHNAMAQNVGIGTDTPTEKLHVVGGARIENLSGTGYRLVQADATGVLSTILDGTSGQVLTTNGAGTLSFQSPSGSSTAWELLGNAGTVSGTNFLGTTDAQSLDFRTNGILRTRITLKGQIEVFNTGLSVFVGEGAGANDDLSNNFNVFLGHQAGFTSTTGGENSATGYQALYSNTTGLRNNATGAYALYSNTTGNYNSATGVYALTYNTTGNYNVATGYLALRSNTTGSYNSASGYVALYYNTTGYYNSAMGYRTLFNNTTGNNNSATGYQALYSNTTGNDNSATGGYALFNNTIGNNNTAIGYRAGDNITVGNKNIVIGYNIDAPVATGSNQLNIGNIIYATGVDGTGTTVSTGNVGVGVNAPTEKLHVQGGARITSLTGTNNRLVQANGTGVLSDISDGSSGQVLTTNGAGALSFQTPGGNNTLDMAYDEGGAGAGRQIAATNGAVRINGEDGFIVTGTLGWGDLIEVSGAGTRMFFNPYKAAFRAGRVTGTEWDNANIGLYSTAMGSNTSASGDYSTAMGENTIASGGNSTAMGYATTAPSGYETAIGRYNTSYVPASTSGWNTADRLFVVGNGTGVGFESDAMVILKNGNIGIGTASPNAKLDVEGDIEVDGEYTYETAQARTLSIPINALHQIKNESSSSASYLVHESYVAGYYGESGYCYFKNGSSANTAVATAPVYLPDGAIVTSLSVRWFDTNTTNDASLSLERIASLSINNSQMGVVNTSGSSNGPAGMGTTTDNTISNATIDNSTYVYYIKMTSIENSNNLGFCKIEISYTVTQAD